MAKQFNENYLKKVEVAKKQWEETTLGKALEAFGVTECPNSFYTPLDIADDDFLERVNFPGQYPFTASAYPCSVPGSGPVVGGWYLGGGGSLVRAGRYLGYGTAEDSRAYYESEIQRGRRGGPNLAFDLPTQLGLDSDDPPARGEVGKTGVAIDTLYDMETIYEPFRGNLDLDKIATNWTINAPANVILAMYVALAKKRKIPLGRLRGTPQNDILKEYIARGTYVFPPKESLRMIRDTISYCTKNIPRMNVVSISGIHMTDAGATTQQGLAFSYSNAIAYIQAGIDAGLHPDECLPRFSFNTLGGSMEILKEIAARRAARRMWAKITRDRFGAKNPRCWILREAGGYMVGDWTMTLQRPLNNLTRGVIGGVAAALAGYIPSAEPPYDESLGLGWSVEGQQLAEDAARILHYECKLTQTTDPLAGSYYIEHLTDKIEDEVWKLIEKIDGMGGAVNAIDYMKREVANSAYEWQKKIESKEEIVVGINEFTGDHELEVLPNRVVPYPYDPKKREDAEETQISKLRKVKNDRDNGSVNAALRRLEAEAKDANACLLPPIIEAVEAYASIGEVFSVLKTVFGTYSGYGIL
jgi:methylmalonyl-CoA mutase N-terminal domain/subunit